MPYPILSSNHDIACHPNEQPVLDDAGAGFQLAGQAAGSAMGPKSASRMRCPVGMEGRVAVHAQLWLCAEGLQVSRLRFPSEGDDPRSG